MHICDYGCGQEAKFPFKNGKWCCSKSFRQCLSQREKTSIQAKEEWKDPNSGLNSKSCKEKQSNARKAAYKDPNSIYNSDLFKENQSNKMKELHKDPNSKYNSDSYKQKQSNNMKKTRNDPNSKYNLDSYKQKQSKRMKELRKDPNSVYNSKSYKEKHSNSIKEAWENPNSKYNLDLYKESQRKRMEEEWNNPDSGLNSVSCKKKKSNAIKKAHRNPNSKYNSKYYREKISNIITELYKDPNSVFNSYLYKENHKIATKLTIEKINERYPFFSKIEEMRYNPDKPGEKEIQVRCKNHNCKNSKEKGGWFTTIGIQISYRIQALEKPRGFGESHFYCSQHCKDTCILYNLHGDPYKETNKPYTSAELKTFNKLVLKRDKEICYYCAKHHATIVHHLRPQKLEPFFALDPDYAISVCEKCHYKYGHPTGSEHSTGNLAKIVCSVESQKFLNQKL